MGQHRDNSYANFIKDTIAGESSKLEGHPSGGGENSQVVGSNVLVLTMEKTHEFDIQVSKKGENTDQKKSYITSPRHQFVCSNLTISVLDPIDDILMTHQLIFSYGRKTAITTDVQ